MFRIAALLILLVTTSAQAQQDSVYARAYRFHNPDDKVSIFMENKSRPAPGSGEETFAITITVTNIVNDKGILRFKFYDESTPFPDTKGFLRIAVPKSEVVNGTFTATYYGFRSQLMGIALLDDENDNWELDLGWFFPKEGHAFSDYYHTAFRRPVYSDFKFLLTADKHVVMKMRYY